MVCRNMYQLIPEFLAHQVESFFSGALEKATTCSGVERKTFLCWLSMRKREGISVEEQEMERKEGAPRILTPGTCS